MFCWLCIKLCKNVLQTLKSAEDNRKECMVPNFEPVFEQSDIFYSQVCISLRLSHKKCDIELVTSIFIRISSLVRFYQRWLSWKLVNRNFMLSLKSFCHTALKDLVGLPIIQDFDQLKSFLRCSSRLSMKSSAYSSVNSREIPLLPEISSENSSQNCKWWRIILWFIHHHH